GFIRYTSNPSVGCGMVRPRLSRLLLNVTAETSEKQDPSAPEPAPCPRGAGLPSFAGPAAAARTSTSAASAIGIRLWIAHAVFEIVLLLITDLPCSELHRGIRGAP